MGMLKPRRWASPRKDPSLRIHSTNILACLSLSLRLYLTNRVVRNEFERVSNRPRPPTPLPLSSPSCCATTSVQCHKVGLASTCTGVWQTRKAKSRWRRPTPNHRHPLPEDHPGRGGPCVCTLLTAHGPPPGSPTLEGSAP